MQVASRPVFWEGPVPGTEIKLAMTDETGLYIKFAYHVDVGVPVSVDWGDGTKSKIAPWTRDEDRYVDHTYAAKGRYDVVVRGVRSIGLRFLDGHPQYSYDKAVISVVDTAGQLRSSQSAAFKRASNLERFIAPNCRWQGQRDFAYCTSLREVVIGENSICYDGTYEFCSALVRYETKSTHTCWRTVWYGCSSIAELKLGAVDQFGPDCFKGCTLLQNVWIDNRTMDQVRQVAPSGNIIGGYGAKYPWGAHTGMRFHCTDGVLTV